MTIIPQKKTRPKGLVKNLRNRSSFFEAEGWYSKEELTMISEGA
jgi:hypothetical protein